MKFRQNGTRHQRKPGGNDIAIVDASRHKAWHLLFQDWKIGQIVDELNYVWIDPDYRLEIHSTRKE